MHIILDTLHVFIVVEFLSNSTCSRALKMSREKLLSIVKQVMMAFTKC